LELKLPEDGRVVPKFLGVIKVSNFIYVVCVFGWLIYKLGE